MITTWLYTVRAGRDVRIPWRDVTLTSTGPYIDWSHAEPYDEPPLRAQMTTREQQRLEHMVGERMTRTDNRNAGLTRNGKPHGQSRKDRAK
jgi:hypothetical protein